MVIKIKKLIIAESINFQLSAIIIKEEKMNINQMEGYLIEKLSTDPTVADIFIDEEMTIFIRRVRACGAPLFRGNCIDPSAKKLCRDCMLGAGVFEFLLNIEGENLCEYDIYHIPDEIDLDEVIAHFSDCIFNNNYINAFCL